MSDVEAVQAGTFYVVEPITGPRPKERVRWPDGVGVYMASEESTDGVWFWRVQPEIDGVVSNEVVLVPAADAELTGEVYVWGYEDEDMPEDAQQGTPVIDEAPSTPQPVAAACCSTCAQNGGTCAGRKKNKMVAAEIDDMETIDSETPDLEAAIAELSAKYDELNARLVALETEETTEEDETDMGDEPMMASVVAFPESVLAAISANV